MKEYYGVQGSAASWVTSEEIQALDSVLVVVPTEREVPRVIADLRTFGVPQQLVAAPGREALPFEMVQRDVQFSTRKSWIFASLSLPDARTAYVASVPSLFQRFAPLRSFRERSFRLAEGDELDREALHDRFLNLGYVERTNVEEVGEVALRGGVLDFFPAGRESPLRIELVADVIQSLRPFSPKNQRTLASDPHLSEVEVAPARERLLWSELIHYSGENAEALKETFQRYAEEREVPLRESTEILQALQEDLILPGIELYEHIFPLPWSSWGEASLPVVLIDELRIREESEKFAALVEEREERFFSEHTLIPPKEQLFLSHEEVQSFFCENAVFSANALHMTAPGEDGRTDDESQKLLTYPMSELSLRLSSGKGIRQGETQHPFQPLGDLVNTWRSHGNRVAFVVGSDHRANRLQRILLDLNMECPINRSLVLGEWIRERSDIPMVILRGEISEGVQIPSLQVILIGEQEIFGEASTPKKEKAVSVKKLLNSLSQLRPGDCVVHIDYGIGKYHGFTHRTVDGCGTDLLEIEYADSTLFLPMTNIAKVQRYTGVEGQEPSLDKLSSQKWEKTKAKVRRSVEVLAGDLVKLYAARQVAKGWRFDPAGAQDEEFAEGFPFQETDDQLQAIEETLADMARERPMDRLICGDVGFGKTEVALRAAYKATQHGKQVALLCPTTILADQHYQSFQKRLAEFPARAGAISRFYSAEQNKQTLAQLKSGELDIIIGTHKLLSRDIDFRDLGLLIIDEEHRFGVKQKERLKQFKKHIDVLTLTATPIPRTLHMSLLQLRDISIISTPPTDRRTVRTFVAPEDENTIRDAILRELQRNGQIFFVHNRVKTIELIAAQLRELVPEARIVFAHGQMPEAKLEEIMHQFLNHEIDILLSTTIVESGIDIPNANTIIIDRADTFGLAQLYQLRGRVGRSNRQAYCYFLVPKKKRLTGDAQERLRALQSLDELGVGFQLAVRDLEIRGAGNLLGKEQSGSVLSVGFELYTRILDEAIHHLSGEELAYDALLEPEVKIDQAAFIPEEYIPDVQERMVIYQRMSSLRTPEEALALSDEMEDRFGAIPEESSLLIDLMCFRGMLKSFGVVRCEIGQEKYSVIFDPKSPVSIEKVIELVKSHPKRFRLGKNGSLTVKNTKISNMAPKKIFDEVLLLLRRVLPDGDDLEENRNV
ncbi:transcription-repair coupling factor [bacterium]|nr:transcription-repair coupling factor [bacterium]